MPRRIRLVPHLADDQLEARYRLARDLVERSHWHFLWLLAGGMTATAVTAVTGYFAYWIGQVARRYNHDGPVSAHDRRHRAGASTTTDLISGRPCVRSLDTRHDVCRELIGRSQAVDDQIRMLSDLLLPEIDLAEA
jgi:hypothetical protein